MSGISGAEIRNSSGTRITSMTPSTAASLYVPANGGKSSSRTATISVSSSDSENCSSADSGLTSSVSVKQDGDTTYTHHYDYDVSLSKGTYADIACDAAGYTPGTYATLTAKRRPVHYWTVGGTETGDAVWSNVTADITGSNGGGGVDDGDVKLRRVGCVDRHGRIEALPDGVTERQHDIVKNGVADRVGD